MRLALAGLLIAVAVVISAPHASPKITVKIQDGTNAAQIFSCPGTSAIFRRGDTRIYVTMEGYEW